MGATLTTLGAILKDYYLPPVTEQLNNAILLLTRINPSAEELFGNQAVLPLHSKRSSGIGVAAEGAALPSAGSQGYEKAVFDLKYLYGRVEVTGPSQAKTASTAGAFLQSMKSELDGIRKDLQKDLARQVYGSGLGNGLIAKCGTTTASRTVVLNDKEAITKGQIYVNMVIDIVASNGTPITDGTDRTVTDVDVTNGQITIDSTGNVVTTSSSHYIARANGAGAEITGLTEIVSTSANTSLGGLDETATGKSFWANQRATGSSVSFDVLNTAFNTIKVFAGDDPSLLATSFGVERAIYNLFTSNMRYVDTQELKGGWKGIMWKNLPIVGDLEHPWGRFHLLCEDHLKVFSPRDWHFIDDDGLTIRMVSGYDKAEALLRRYINLGVRKRNCQYVLSGISGDAGV